MVKNIEFEAKIPSIKNNLFNQIMVNSLNKLEFSDDKYQTICTILYGNDKGEFLFPKNEFVSFGTDFQSMYFISTRFLKDKIDGVCVPQFKLAYIFNTTHSLCKNWVSFFVKYIMCGGGINS